MNRWERHWAQCWPALEDDPQLGSPAGQFVAHVAELWSDWRRTTKLVVAQRKNPAAAQLAHEELLSRATGRRRRRCSWRRTSPNWCRSSSAASRLARWRHERRLALVLNLFWLRVTEALRRYAFHFCSFCSVSIGDALCEKREEKTLILPNALLSLSVEYSTLQYATFLRRIAPQTKGQTADAIRLAPSLVADDVTNGNTDVMLPELILSCRCIRNF